MVRVYFKETKLLNIMHIEAIHQYIYFFQGHETLETSDNCLENIVNGLEFGAGVQMRAWVQITLILLLEKQFHMHILIVYYLQKRKT